MSIERFKLPMPEISGNAGIGEVVALMRDPSYMKLLGKVAGAGAAAGVVVRRLPPQVALPMVLLSGIYIGLEMAAWMEEQAKQRQGLTLDATVLPEIEPEDDECL